MWVEVEVEGCAMLRLGRSTGMLRAQGTVRLRWMSMLSHPSVESPISPEAGAAGVAAAAAAVLRLPIPDEEVRNLQDILAYKFSNRTVLEEALIHTSYPKRGMSSLFVPRSPRSYKVLQPTGLLNLNKRLSLHLSFTSDEERDDVDALCSINLSPHKLARTTLRLGLYNFLRRRSPKLDRTVDDFIKQQQGNIPYRGRPIRVPTVLTDLVEAMFGAVTLDNDNDGFKAWEALADHLLPIIYWESFEQAVTVLSQVCKDFNMSLNFEKTKVAGLTTTMVFVNKCLHGSATSTVESTAELVAAMDALNKLPNYMLSGTMLEKVHP